MSQNIAANRTRVSEPFRLFFPAGMVVGILGVSLWPLFLAQWLPYYPGIAHNRLMIQGFAGLFIFGFLMTAGPRLLGTLSFERRLVWAVFGLSLLSSLAHLANHTSIGDFIFVGAAALVILAASKKFKSRTDTPPPGFPLAFLGIVSACFGSLCLAVFTKIAPSASGFLLGKILLFQGFTLLPLIGVGGFFFPKILGGSNQHDFPIMKEPNDTWKRHFRTSLFAALGFVASIALELAGEMALAYGIRASTLIAYLIIEVPFREFSKKASIHGRQLIFGLSTIAIGLIGTALFPERQTAWLHAYFIVGLTGIIILVSARVVFGHSGQPDLIKRNSFKLACVTATLALAAITRIFADYWLSVQMSHYLYAAVLWLMCATFWMLAVAPKVKTPKQQANRSC